MNILGKTALANYFSLQWRPYRRTTTLTRELPFSFWTCVLKRHSEHTCPFQMKGRLQARVLRKEEIPGGNFPKLTKGLALAARERVPTVALDHLKFYHGIRNHLYHQGNGISSWACSLATTLLNQLLDIDCTRTVPLELEQDIPVDQHAFDTLKREFPKDIDLFQHLINVLMESTEPRMIYPRAIRTLAETCDFDITLFPRKLWKFRDLIDNNIGDKDLKSWLLTFLADDLHRQHEQVIANTQFLMGLGKDPISFYSFLIGIRLLPMEEVSMDILDMHDDISFIAQDEYSLMDLYDSLPMLERTYRAGEGEEIRTER